MREGEKWETHSFIESNIFRALERYICNSVYERICSFGGAEATVGSTLDAGDAGTSVSSSQFTSPPALNSLSDPGMLGVVMLSQSSGCEGI